MKIIRYAKLLPYLLIYGCSYHIERENFKVEAEEGFFRSYVYTQVKENGKPVPGTGKLTICNGYAGFISDLMQNAAIVTGSALIGAGIADSGDNISNNSSSRSNSGASSISNSNSSATALQTQTQTQAQLQSQGQNQNQSNQTQPIRHKK